MCFDDGKSPLFHKYIGPDYNSNQATLGWARIKKTLAKLESNVHRLFMHARDIASRLSVATGPKGTRRTNKPAGAPNSRQLNRRLQGIRFKA